MPLLGFLKDRHIRKDKIKETSGDLNVGKAPGLDGIASEPLNHGGGGAILWLERVLGVCFEVFVAPRDFRDMRMVSVYKGKGEKYECNSYRGVCLISAVGKVYGSGMINRVRKGTEAVIGEEECGFRKGRGGDVYFRFFVVRQLCESF